MRPQSQKLDCRGKMWPTKDGLVPRKRKSGKVKQEGMGLSLLLPSESKTHAREECTAKSEQTLLC